MATNLAAAAWRAPWATLGAAGTATAAFAAAAALATAMGGAALSSLLWFAAGGDAWLALARAVWSATAAKVPLYKELSALYDMVVLVCTVDKFSQSALAAPRHASDASLTWLRGAAVTLFGTGAAGSLALRGALAATALARRNSHFHAAFQLARYRSTAALVQELQDSIVVTALGTLVAFGAGGIALATDTDWVHVPCFVVCVVASGFVVIALLKPWFFNAFELL